MLLQTNSYVVPKDKRQEHARLVRRFRQCLNKLGCEHFEVYEQVSQNWTGKDSGGRYVQIMRFRDRRHQMEVQAAERSDPTAQALIQEFCELINFPFQQQQGLFAVGFYTSVLPNASSRENEVPAEATAPQSAPADDQIEVPELAPETPPQHSAPARRPPVPPPPTPPNLASADELDVDSGLTDLSDSKLLDLPELHNSPNGGKKTNTKAKSSRSDLDIFGPDDDNGAPFLPHPEHEHDSALH
jgi:hypothetical protein